MRDLERRAIAEAVQGVLRHDARNKVGAIRNAAFFLRKKTEKSPLWAEPRVADFFSLIEAQLKELEDVLGERAGSGVVEAPPVVCVAHCVRAALSGHPVTEGAEVLLRLDEQVEAAIGAGPLTLALRAVLDNAVDALGPAAERRVTITVTGPEAGPSVRVEDSGPGFPPARLAKAIAPLESTRPGRAGLGLAVAWRMVRNAGGDLVVENGAAGGGVVELRLRAPA
ncbi:MAG: ATP-binding protein [Archangium sp.]|nr:ATP-binding protein [Archangium sp.]